MSRLRLAVVGTGRLGRIHARIAAALQSVQLVAVVDPVASAREKVAAETGAQPLADYRDLFGDVDAAIVATPTSSHLQVACDLLRGGLHLLVEKPLAASPEDAQQLVELARRQQLVLQVGHVERFNPALTSVRDRLADPKYIEAKRLSGYPFRSTDIGVVLDLMIHDIDVVLTLVQSPVEQIDAVGISVLGNHEDMVNARLRFASGCIANLTASRVSYAPQRSMQVFTSHCCATIDFAARRSTIVEPDAKVLGREFSLDALSPEQKNHLREHLFTDLLVKHELPALDTNAIEQEQLDFAASIRLGSSPQVSANDGRDAVAVAQRIVEQVRSHAWDGQKSARRGAFAMPESLSMIAGVDPWSLEDTVVMRRKAG